jgi:hypothetical protein
MKLVKESIEFERGLEPSRAMGIGKFYEIWRKEHNKKPIARITFYLSDLFENKKRFIATLYYEHNWEGYSDSIWWGRSELLGEWEKTRQSFAISNMQNKPANDFFEGNDDERIMWIDDFRFNDDMIDPLSKGRVKETIRGLIDQWWDVDFETALKDWFKTGIMTLHNIEYEVL